MSHRKRREKQRGKKTYSKKTAVIWGGGEAYIKIQEAQLSAFLLARCFLLPWLKAKGQSFSSLPPAWTSRLSPPLPLQSSPSFEWRQLFAEMWYRRGGRKWAWATQNVQFRHSNWRRQNRKSWDRVFPWEHQNHKNCWTIINKEDWKLPINILYVQGYKE